MYIRKKRELGKYYTKNSPFQFKHFLDWSKLINLQNEIILEPFAGTNNIISMLNGWVKGHKSYDISPSEKSILKNDSLINFPIGYNVCITNPPWLSNYSAKRKKLNYPSYIRYDNLYKYSIELALKNCKYVAMILPASFLNCGLFHERLHSVSLLSYKVFEDTDYPSCLALFNKNPSDDFTVYDNDIKIGSYYRLKNRYCKFFEIDCAKKYSIEFNQPSGQLGLRNLDNTKRKAIQFCFSHELDRYDIKCSSRLITKIRIANFHITSNFIETLNHILFDFRKKTNDIFLTPFKGLREDGNYRRRLDYNTARGLINAGLRKFT